MGKVSRYTNKNDASMNIVTMLSQADIPISSLRDLELLVIRNPIEQNPKEEKKRLMCFTFKKRLYKRKMEDVRSICLREIDYVFLTNNYELSLKKILNLLPEKGFQIKIS